jgi:Transposase IS66 family
MLNQSAQNNDRRKVELGAYQVSPGNNRRLALRARFDRIFRRRTGCVTLDRLLARLHANKAELLMVLDRPEIPLHTNASENDIRCQLTRRKLSAGPPSDPGRDCRDGLLGLAKTCAKHAIALWDYLVLRRLKWIRIDLRAVLRSGR